MLARTPVVALLLLGIAGAGVPPAIGLGLGSAHSARAAALAALLASAVAVAALTLTIARPLRSLASDARAMAAGDPGRRASERGPREVAGLARALNAMAAARGALRALVEASPLAIWRLDVGGRVQTWSPAAERIFGWRAEEVLGRSLPTVPAEREDEFRANLRRVVSGETFTGVEVRRRRKDGAPVDVSLSSAPVRGARGEVEAVVTFVEDVTARRRARDAVRRLDERVERRVAARTAALEAANRELEAFTHSVSHELRGPARAMERLAALLLAEDPAATSERARRDLGLVRDGAREMAALVEALLVLSRAGRQDLRRTAMDMTRLARDVAGELHRGEGDRAVEWVLADLPPCSGDPALLRLVWVNLLDNALKFTRGRAPARIEVAADHHPTGPVYRVRDNGVGFGAGQAHRLFTAFQRLHSPGRYEGSGIGLAVVRRVVERHGGRAWADSTPGRGATFSFTIPGVPDDV